LLAVSGHRDLPAPARPGNRRQIRGVGPDSLTGGNTARTVTVAPRWSMRAGFSSRWLQAIASPIVLDATELVLVTGERYLVKGEVRQVERMILDAARGSIMQLAWLSEADTGADLAVNPEHVVMLRAAGP